MRTITSQTTQVREEAIIEGDTVSFVYQHSDEEAPKVVTFTLKKGSRDKGDYTGNTALQGNYFADADTVDFKRVNASTGIPTSLATIVQECKAIVQEHTTEEPEEEPQEEGGQEEGNSEEE